MSGDSDDLEGRRDGLLNWLHEACFGRVEATEEEIGQGISLLGTIKQLIRRRDED